MDVLQKEHLYYDISAIKEIPILSVADRMGIPAEKRGRNYWCKVRQENNPSVILHTDKNTFYDFGNQVHGDVIRFVQYINECSQQECTPGQAISFLAKEFSIPANMTRQELFNRSLTNWEYTQIGLYGDMASKNITFPIDSLTLHELCEMSQYYQMPMNQLLKKDPEAYKNIILNKASVYVDKLRNHYFLGVWNYFHLCYAFGGNSINLFQAMKVRNRFDKETKTLNKAEQILYRAGKRAGLQLPKPEHHDPVAVIRQLLSGDLPITLGNTSLEDLSILAERLKSSICEITIPADQYFDERLSHYCHYARYQSGTVTLQYLSSDAKELSSFLKEMKSISPTVLEERIQNSKSKTASAAVLEK